MRRAEILAAAQTIFVRDGYQGATIRKIAQEVGVSSTALYMHFRDKDEILVEICEQAMAGLLLDEPDASGGPSDPVQRTRVMMDAYIRFGLANASAYRMVFGAEAVNPALGQRTYQRFRAVVADIAAEGRLRQADAEVAAQLLWSACHGLVVFCLSRPAAAWTAAETLRPAMVDVVFQGLVKL